MIFIRWFCCLDQLIIFLKNALNTREPAVVGTTLKIIQTMVKADDRSLLHARADTHTHAHIDTHSLTRTHPHTNKYSLLHTQTHAHTHTRTHAHTQTNSMGQGRRPVALGHMRTHAHARTHTHTKG